MLTLCRPVRGGPPIPDPVVVGVSPTSGDSAGGESVTITGGGFQAGATVTFGAQPATSVVVVSGSTITCTTPAVAEGDVDVVVTNGNGNTDTLTDGFSYLDEGGGGGPEILAFSNWDTATGQLNTALLDDHGDDALWTAVAGSAAPPNRAVEVVAAPEGWTATTNVLRVEMTAADTLCRSNTVIPEGVDFYVRFYNMVEAGSSGFTSNHSAKLSIGVLGEDMHQVLWAMHNANGTTYRPFFNVVQPSHNVDAQVQFEGPALNQGEWYRFEFHVEVVDFDNLLFRTWPRIYDDSDTLIADADDYSTGSTSLSAHWAGGATATAVDWDFVRRLLMGTEGPGGGSPHPGEYWYYAAVAVSLDDWVGPI